MDLFLEALWNVLGAGVQLLLQPFYYISILLIMILYRRQVQLERKLFHVRLHSYVVQTWRTVVGGLAAGLGVSLIFLFIGMTLTTEGILCIWIVSILLLLIRVRYLCMAYSVGLLAVMQFVLNLFPNWLWSGAGGEIIRVIRELNIPALLCLVGILHIAEALLVRWQGASFAGPLFFEGKRGKMVGGYQLQSLWPVPLFLLIPAETNGGIIPWTPLIGGEAWHGGYTLMALPMVIGFTEMTIGMLPKVKVKISSGRLFGYGVIVFVLALLSSWWSPLVVLGGVVAIAMHEWLVWLSGDEEQKLSPFFVHSNRGLKVLAVLPGSPAEEMGILTGETIYKVNGVPVLTKEEMHAALRRNAAYCKLEVLNLAGESKFLQRALYAGDHHQLGCILAPDDRAPVAVQLQPLSLLQLLRSQRSTRAARRSPGPGPIAGRDEAGPSAPPEAGAESRGR